MTAAATVATPPGPFTVLADDDGVVLASGWTEDVAGLARLAGVPAPERLSPDLGAATRAVGDYFAGDLAAIDSVPVRPGGGAFHATVRETLRAVPPGAQVTYTELAARAGRPAAVRAAGAACASNPASLFVPCHRAVRRDGGLAGFLWGIPVKRALLAHERAGAA